MVERTNGSPWFFIVGIVLVVAGLAAPLLVDAALGGVQWLVRGAGVLVAIGGGVLIGFGVRRRNGRESPGACSPGGTLHPMSTPTPSAGSTIPHEIDGNGPALILVDGAMCFRDGGPMRSIAAALRDRLTVVLYDRRGRGESTDALADPSARAVAVARE